MSARFAEIQNALYVYEKQGRLPTIEGLSVEQRTFLGHITEAVPPSLYAALSDEIDDFIKGEHQLKSNENSADKKVILRRRDELIKSFAQRGELRPVMRVTVNDEIAGYVVADLSELAKISV